MVDIAERAGMSAGHVMYYFPTKADLLMQALEWSESLFLSRAEDAIRSVRGARERLSRLVEISLPVPGIDPAWILWLETWAHAPHDDQVAKFQQGIEQRWLSLLARVVKEGQASGELRDLDVDEFVASISALVDGLSIRMMGGEGSLDRQRVLRMCEEEVERRLRR